MSTAVFRIEHDVALQKVSLTPYTKPRTDEPNRFEMYLRAQRIEGMTHQANVGTNSPTWANFSITCDEGTAIGGGNTAPCPLAYFSAGIAFCFLSHVAMLTRARDIKLDQASVELRMKFSIVNRPEQMRESGLSGSSDGLEMHFIVESDAPAEQIKWVYNECTRACVAIQSIARPVAFESHLHLNGAQLN